VKSTTQLKDFFPSSENFKPDYAVTSLTHCIEELVLNAIASSPNCISIRVDVTRSYAQVVDNGVGITQPEMLKLAEKYEALLIIIVVVFG